MNKNKYHYDWALKDTVFTKTSGKVFSCFSCGGGSTMGYKLAGFDVIGCNEIDPKMMEVYKLNHDPNLSFLESIETFKNRDDLPVELYNLDILDGSPPCSSFSLAGNREKDWGKEKKFREGQKKQVLDNLFFDFIDLAKKLQPKIVVAENVKGLLLGNAFKYVQRIYKEFDKAGYHCQHWLLNASKMRVPQRRERVFFICLRKDIAEPFLYQKDLFDVKPLLKLEFDYKEIPFKEIECSAQGKKIQPFLLKHYDNVKVGESFGNMLLRTTGKSKYFNYSKCDPERSIPTITTSDDQVHYKYPNYLSDKNIIKGGSFPYDYNFDKLKVNYIVGMSVPPVMMARIAEQVYDQWLSKINVA